MHYVDQLYKILHILRASSAAQTERLKTSISTHGFDHIRRLPPVTERPLVRHNGYDIKELFCASAHAHRVVRWNVILSLGDGWRLFSSLIYLSKPDEPYTR